MNLNDVKKYDDADDADSGDDLDSSDSDDDSDDDEEALEKELEKIRKEREEARKKKVWHEEVGKFFVTPLASCWPVVETAGKRSSSCSKLLPFDFVEFDARAPYGRTYRTEYTTHVGFNAVP